MFYQRRFLLSVKAAIVAVSLSPFIVNDLDLYLCFWHPNDSGTLRAFDLLAE